MYYDPWMYGPHSRYLPYTHTPMYHYGGQLDYGNTTQHWNYPQSTMGMHPLRLKDYGAKPFVINIHEASKRNNSYRTALWTGQHLQVTLMNLNAGEDIGLEMHPAVDQFFRIEQGQGIVQMGNTREQLNFVRNVHDDDAIMIPAGTWHNVTNTGNIPLKIYSIYAPPQHPFGTVHPTKMDAMKDELSH
jgi:mannose-6-phosphate isomerase-like protein (cupin superfamily)